jgi:hypothetical protein
MRSACAVRTLCHFLKVKEAVERKLLLQISTFSLSTLPARLWLNHNERNAPSQADADSLDCVQKVLNYVPVRCFELALHNFSTCMISLFLMSC